MSRHRIVRSMNYSDEYDGYDDVYGHSVEDDYSMSPSDAAFMYDRDSRQPAQFSAFLTTEEDIVEEEEEDGEGGVASGGGGRKQSFVKPELSDVDEARLRSCRDEVQSVVGDSVADSTLDETILRCDFDVTRTLDTLLQSPQSKSSTVQKATNPETPLSKTKTAAKLEGKDYFRIMSNHNDYNSKNLNKCNAASQSKRMSTAEQIAVSVAPSQCRTQIPVEVESREKLSNSSKHSPRTSGFSSLQALKLKHKQTSAETSRKCAEPDESKNKVDIVTLEEKNLEKNTSTINLECVSAISVCSSELKGSENEIPETVNVHFEKKSSGSGSAVESKARSVCTPGKSSSLAALAKRCRNPSERRPLPRLSGEKTELNTPIVSDQSVIIRDSQFSEFEKLSVQQTKNSTKLTESDNLNTVTKADQTNKDTVLIDLMAALHSPIDERQPALDEPDIVVSSETNLICQLQQVKANIISNVTKVKNEFHTISCSAFGEIICKTFVFDCKEFALSPIVYDGKIKPFAFDVMSPDDEIRKFRTKW